MTHCPAGPGPWRLSRSPTRSRPAVPCYTGIFRLGTFFKLLSGFGLCVLGVIGIILPIMPGWVFLIPGLIILSDFFPPLKRLLHWAREKFEQETAKIREKQTKPGPGAK